jgi:hypothetical protein
LVFSGQVEVAVVQDPLLVALGEDCVRGWLGGLRSVTRSNYRSLFKHWMLWLWSQPGWAGRMPSELLDFQENAKGRERKLLLGLMKEFVQWKGGTYISMVVKLSHIRSFFTANGVDIPAAIGWNPEPTREPVPGKLTMEQVREIILHAKIRERAIFLTMFQGLMDLERFHQFNLKHARALVDHLKSKSLDEPFRIDLLHGRKRNHQPFYTFIYHDALEAWQTYFERIRGWPESGQALAVRSDNQQPLAKTAVRPLFDTVARQLRIKPPTRIGMKDKGYRTGVAPHEAFRDVVRSLLTTAKKKGFDRTCAEFWMGHTIDPYHYNKFAELEPEYVQEQAKIAAEFLNTVSGSYAKENQDVKTMQEKIQRLELAVRVLQDASELKVNPPRPAP